MKEIGMFLKEARTLNGVSIEEASDDLNVAASEIENLEEGNIKAFKDIYSLKNLVKEYSKYLGQDPDKLIDEFNDFMFEHTSKISLEDIKEARKNMKVEEKPRVVSPYTYVKKKRNIFKKIKWKYVITFFIVILIIAIIIFLYNMIGTSEEKVSKELRGGNLYEYTK